MEKFKAFVPNFVPVFSKGFQANTNIQLWKECDWDNIVVGRVL